LAARRSSAGAAAEQDGGVLGLDATGPDGGLEGTAALPAGGDEGSAASGLLPIAILLLGAGLIAVGLALGAGRLAALRGPRRPPGTS
ncbi:MAG TPA: hypothetical protein VFR63_01745, partial [Gaiellaceae bacterium]|nr:hypothetical protein [Gaiellaceae bacterium]